MNQVNIKCGFHTYRSHSSDLSTPCSYLLRSLRPIVTIRSLSSRLSDPTFVITQLLGITWWLSYRLKLFWITPENLCNKNNFNQGTNKTPTISFREVASSECECLIHIYWFAEIFTSTPASSTANAIEKKIQLLVVIQVLGKLVRRRTYLNARVPVVHCPSWCTIWPEQRSRYLDLGDRWYLWNTNPRKTNAGTFGNGLWRWMEKISCCSPRAFGQCSRA